MTKLFKRYSYILFSIISFTSYGQNEKIIGFWEVTNVSIGHKTKTPVAKWIKINKDKSYQSGNGGLQHINGSWNYNLKDSIFNSVDSLGLKDEFGGFKVSFVDKNMFWEREEDGMLVKVTLTPTSKLPMSPADYLEGVWSLTEIIKDKQPILNHPDYTNRSKILIRWDRVYVNFNTKGEKSYGFWHIHGHKPQLTFLPRYEGGIPEKWEIQVNKTRLILVGISERNKGIQQQYLRKNTL